MERNNQTIVRGDSITLILNLKRMADFGPEASSIPAESTVKCGLKTKTGTQEFACTIEDALTGKVKCDLSSAQTTNLNKGDEQEFYVLVKNGETFEKTWIFPRALNIRDRA